MLIRLNKYAISKEEFIIAIEKIEKNLGVVK